MRYKGKSLSLERKDPSQLGEILPQMLRIMHLSSGMDEQLVMRAWDKVTGIYIVQVDEERDAVLLHFLFRGA